MTDDEIIDVMKTGEVVNFGCHARNPSIMALMSRLESEGLVEITDASLSQETRANARWIGPTDSAQQRTDEMFRHFKTLKEAKAHIAANPPQEKGQPRETLHSRRGAGVSALRIKD